MKHTTITARDLECLEHMRNVGHLVGELMQCRTAPPYAVTPHNNYSSPP